MQLRRLEAYGFKSFANKLDIEFDRGITAIVGPNGSGKSNITDAIRWVLGEQNVRNLRGSKTEDIIFTGSASRRALGVAEVSLTFDNHDGTLPVDFAEVVITRRLFRSGESEFYINKARCRLKDIYDLFADTGLGRDAISVISQNKIDQVLNSRPEERRLLFEEAAGITKYRNRKKESLKKLEDTEQNVLRVNDILMEIENQLGPLAESAEKTRRYNALNEDYGSCKLTLLLNRYEEQKRSLDEVQKQKAEINALNHDSEVKINLLEVEKERLNHELLEVEKSLQVLNDKNNELNTQVEKNNTAITLCQERLRQSDENEQRFLVMRENLKKNKAAAEDKLQSLELEIASIDGDAAKLDAAIAALHKREQEILQEIQRAEICLAEMQKKSFEQVQALSSKKNDIVLYERDIAEKKQQCGELARETAELGDQQKKKQADLQGLRQDLMLLAQECEQAKIDQESLSKHMQEKISAKQISLGKMQQASQELNTARARLRFLQGMQEEYEGFGRGVKRVLKNNYPWNKGVCGAVAEVIKIDAKYVTALEIALGGSLQNVITEDDSTAKAAIAFLKQEQLGRVTFLPINTILDNHKKFQDQAIVKSPGIIGYANDLAICEEKYRRIIDFLLAKTVVAENIDAALQFAKSRQFKVKVVTLDGEMLNPGGAMTGGSNARREVSFLNRVGEIEELTKKIDEHQTAFAALHEHNEMMDLAINEVKQNIEQKNADTQGLVIRYAQKKVYVEKAETEHRSGESYVQTLQDKLSGYQAKIEQLTMLLAAGRQDIAALESADNRQKDDDKEFVDVLAGLRLAKDKNSEELVDRRIKKTVIEQKKIRATESRLNLTQMLRQNHEELAALAVESEKLQHDILEINNKLVIIDQENDKLKILRTIGIKDYDNFHKVKLDKLVKIQNQEQELKNLRKKFNDLQNKVHQIDILFTQHRFELNNCLASLRDDYQLSIEEALPLRIGESSAVIARKINALEREMEALGTVNPNAISEYERLGERYAFIKKQADDLIVAKEYLMGIIKEIDVTMSKQFTAAFADISRYFSEIFERLFGGGHAKLELSDANQILEAGIEINVQPPNKKLQSLSVLSGGERALTVIALLFSFLKFRPAPFSVVDEIDAPLDEANVDRFGAFLKEFAENTQFIVVTHRKGTMQVADVMHGVTVEDSGVSKIISVKLEERTD